jgi:hypothetical protein
MRVKFAVFAGLAAPALLLGGGCATMFGKGSYTIQINSYPNEAICHVTDDDGKTYCQMNTPVTLTLRAGGFYDKKNYRINLSKDGYCPVSQELRSQLNCFYLCNILLFIPGLAGLLIIDPATGRMWELPETSIFMSMPKDS